jgi:hypothetical protein
VRNVRFGVKLQVMNNFNGTLVVAEYWDLLLFTGEVLEYAS